MTGVAALSAPTHGAATVWTLESAAKRGLEVAPETRVADAEVGIREGELKRDSAWPNPTVEVRADRKLGLDTGRGGTDVTQLALTQPLPVSRIARQRERAEANLAAAQANREVQRLQLQNQVARALYALQRAEAKYRLAEQRLDASQQYAQTGASGRGRDRLVRYLTPLDRQRLTILQESARQALAGAERERAEAAIGFRQLLALPPDTDVATAALAPPLRFDVPDALPATHPALVAGERALEAARRGIDVARAGRFADPTISVFRERDVFGSEERGFYGVAFGVQVPLWNANRGEVARAAADANRIEAALQANRRDLETAFRDSRLRLARFTEQAEHYAASVLEPSRRFLDLTRRAFTAGEVGVLALLDANNSYFEASQGYLELLAEAGTAAADLRLALGQSLIEEGGR